MPASPSILNEPVLVLNRGYTALRVISVRQAFVLLFRQIAEVISVNQGRYETFDISSWIEIADLQRQFECGDHDWIRAASRYVAAPRIIRLTSSNRQPDFHVRLNRRNLFARDRNRCQYCGKKFSLAELSIDHVVPISRGGANTWDNLVCACIRCNTRKGSRTPREAGLNLITSPRQPRHCPDRALSLRRKQYEEWKVFLNEAYWTVELRD
ncbi:MAG: HNH endonuclease [Phycisphaerae bacterium]|nr:HNH endonuclease [Phycisphaerae bacterium]